MSSATYGSPPEDYENGIPVHDRDCTCRRWRPYVPPEKGYAFCGQCGGWLKRPAEKTLAKITDRRRRKRLAYRLAGLTQDGNPRQRRDRLQTVTKPQVKQGGKRRVGV